MKPAITTIQNLKNRLNVCRRVYIVPLLQIECSSFIGPFNKSRLFSFCEYPLRAEALSLPSDSEQFRIFVTWKVFDIPEQTFDFCLSRLTDVRLSSEKPKGSALLRHNAALRSAFWRDMWAMLTLCGDVFTDIEILSLSRSLMRTYTKKTSPVCQSLSIIKC